MLEENKQVVLRFLEATGTNDAETVEACVDPDGVSVAKGTSKFTGPRRLASTTSEVSAPSARCRISTIYCFSAPR